MLDLDRRHPFPMKVMVTGSRSFTEAPYREQIKEAFCTVLDGLQIDHLIHGGAAGPDTWAAIWASTRPWMRQEMVRPDPQPGESFGKAAYRRNIDMLNLGPDLLVVCWDGTSRGTLHTVTAALSMAVPFVSVRCDLVKRVYDLERKPIKEGYEVVGQGGGGDGYTIQLRRIK